MELLNSLYRIHAPSGAEKPIRKFIRKWVETNIDGVELHYDGVGNMYFKKGECDTYPCVVAHLDQVQHNHSKDFTVYIDDGELFGWSEMNNRQEGLGADDKNGVWVALKCLEKFDVIKVAFFNSEEIGCVGSSSAEMDFFKDCRFIIQPDRRGAHDLITDIYYDEICSKEFADALDADLFGYVPTSGMMTDVLELSERGVGISCINLSCGYYNPHTDKETTKLVDLKNCLEFVIHIIEKCTDVYPHTYEKYTYSRSYSSTYSYPKTGKRIHSRRYYDSDYYDRWYGYDSYDDYEDSYGYGSQFAPSDTPYIPTLSQYYRVEEWIDDLVAWNFDDYWPDDLWKHVETLLEGVMDKASFLAIAEEKWNEYYRYL